LQSGHCLLFFPKADPGMGPRRLAGDERPGELGKRNE
jgi:hypothetical protein